MRGQHRNPAGKGDGKPTATHALPASPADAYERELDVPSAGCLYLLKSSDKPEDALKLVVYSPESGGLGHIWHISPPSSSPGKQQHSHGFMATPPVAPKEITDNSHPQNPVTEKKKDETKLENENKPPDPLLNLCEPSLHLPILPCPSGCSSMDHPLFPPSPGLLLQRGFTSHMHLGTRNSISLV